MAASLQDHFHLMVSEPDQAESSNEFKALSPGYKPKATPEPSVIAAPSRALDGTFRAHILSDLSGPVVFENWSILVKLDSWPADYTTLKALLGKTLYYVPHYHDPAAHRSYDVKVFFEKIGAIELQGPQITGGLHVPIYLVDATPEAS